MNRYLNWLAIALIALVTLIGCSGSNDDKDKPTQTTNYTVVFNTNGGTSVNDHTVVQGNSIASSPMTIKEGYVFEGWYLDNNTFNNKMTFPFTPTASITLHANWTIIPVSDAPDISVIKFEAIPFDPSIDVDQIKYSYTYGDYSFYYIHLGSLRSIPMFSYSTTVHSPALPITYKVEVTQSIRNSVSNSVSVGVGTAKSIIDNHSLTAGTGSKISVEIGAKVGFPGFFEASEKIGGELTFEAHIGNSTTSGFEETTSLARTEERVTEYIESTMEGWSVDLTREFPAGYYRVSCFSSSDVYLYVIKETNTNKLVHFEFKEHVIPNFLSWGLDYSETGYFIKQDASSFEFDMALLENLPPAGMATVTFDKNNSDEGSTETDPQEIMVNIGGRPGNQMPGQSAQPMRPGHTFLGWNTATDGTGATFTRDSTVTSNTTVYARWLLIPEPVFVLSATSTIGGKIVSPQNGYQDNILNGTSVNIEANPDEHYRFLNWTLEDGDAEINNPTSEKTTVKVNSDTKIKAVFEQKRYTLTLRPNDANWGEVAPSYQVDVGGGSSVTIQATPKGFRGFDQWVAEDENTVIFANRKDRTTAVKLLGNATITANFNAGTQFTLVTERNPKNWGNANRSAEGEKHDPNTPISITATPNGGYRFVNWTVLGSGNATFANANSAATTVALGTDAKIRANFLPASAIYGGEVGRLELKSTGTYAVALRVQYLDDNGNMKTYQFGSLTAGILRNIDPGNEPKIPDGSWIRVYASVTSGSDCQGAEYFIYRKNSPKTACYRIPTVWWATPNMYFDGVK
ncbi:MAG: InlB B-repeat-containing protein [Holophagaceae bacterium]|nr:InlB B-repeat-containing protein [Holophagaceae bacterium]